QDASSSAIHPAPPHQVHAALVIACFASESLCTNHIFVRRPDIMAQPTDSSARGDG
ncbi:hypothetical protein P692DRAFT_20741836, partial [Suillus brevipes Sb2]